VNVSVFIGLIYQSGPKIYGCITKSSMASSKRSGKSYGSRCSTAGSWWQMKCNNSDLYNYRLVQSQQHGGHDSGYGDLGIETNPSISTYKILLKVLCFFIFA